MKPISIFIPSYNESRTIEKNVRKAYSIIKSFKIDFNLIVIDDGSTDSTEKILKKLSKELLVSILAYIHKRDKLDIKKIDPVLQKLMPEVEKYLKEMADRMPCWTTKRIDKHVIRFQDVNITSPPIRKLQTPVISTLFILENQRQNDGFGAQATKY